MEDISNYTEQPSVSAIMIFGRPSKLDLYFLKWNKLHILVGKGREKILATVSKFLSILVWKYFPSMLIGIVLN